jgi:hypothetical protein
MPPERTWVVESAKPGRAEVGTTVVAAASAAKPCGDWMPVRPLPIVRMTRRPPMWVPGPIASPAEAMPHTGGPVSRPSAATGVRVRVLAPIVFWASFVPCARGTGDAEAIGPIRKPLVTESVRARAVIRMIFAGSSGRSSGISWPLEPPDLVAGTAVQFLARPVRWPDRCRPGRRGPRRGPLRQGGGEAPDPLGGLAARGQDHRSPRHRPRLQLLPPLHARTSFFLWHAPVKSAKLPPAITQSRRAPRGRSPAHPSRPGDHRAGRDPGRRRRSSV